MEETRQNRGQFIRRLGKTLAVGLGVSLIPVAAAEAGLTTCCPADDAHPCIPAQCFPGQSCFWCRANAGCPGCYICTTQQYCFTTQWCPC